MSELYTLAYLCTLDVCADESSHVSRSKKARTIGLLLEIKNVILWMMDILITIILVYFYIQ